MRVASIFPGGFVLAAAPDGVGSMLALVISDATFVGKIECGCAESCVGCSDAVGGHK